ncbi:hypothetical protein O3P69_003337 [Scylla paramamosain]|uniref:Uncharacterized protein n=1 Tax=Scylla paramamosain TaxID=85552 RepID=A0AAW0UKC7_SCYPA
MLCVMCSVSRCVGRHGKLSTCKRNPVSSHVPLPNNCRPGDAQRDKCAEWSTGANVTDGAINFPLQAVSYPALYAPVMKNKEAVASRLVGDASRHHMHTQTRHEQGERVYMLLRVSYIQMRGAALRGRDWMSAGRVAMNAVEWRP